MTQDSGREKRRRVGVRQFVSRNDPRDGAAAELDVFLRSSSIHLRGYETSSMRRGFIRIKVSNVGLVGRCHLVAMREQAVGGGRHDPPAYAAMDVISNFGDVQNTDELCARLEASDRQNVKK